MSQSANEPSAAPLVQPSKFGKRLALVVMVCLLSLAAILVAGALLGRLPSGASEPESIQQPKSTNPF